MALADHYTLVSGQRDGHWLGRRGDHMLAFVGDRKFGPDDGKSVPPVDSAKRAERKRQTEKYNATVDALIASMRADLTAEELAEYDAFDEGSDCDATAAPDAETLEWLQRNSA